MLNGDFIKRLDSFVAAAVRMRSEYYKANFPNLPNEGGLELMEGQKFIRVVSNNGAQRFAYCFIDKSNGDVLKCDGWKKPAKHARSNIFDADYGLSGVGVHGAKYLK